MMLSLLSWANTSINRLLTAFQRRREPAQEGASAGSPNATRSRPWGSACATTTGWDKERELRRVSVGRADREVGLERTKASLSFGRHRRLRSCDPPSNSVLSTLVHSQSGPLLRLLCSLSVWARADRRRADTLVLLRPFCRSVQTAPRPPTLQLLFLTAVLEAALLPACPSLRRN